MRDFPETDATPLRPVMDLSDVDWTFIGVDAGGTSTRAVHLSRDGTLLRTSCGGASNPYVGIEAGLPVLAAVISRALDNGAVAPGCGVIVTVALSGGDSEALCREYERRLSSRLNFIHVLQVVHDALAPAALLLEHVPGGVVLAPMQAGTIVAGTGSVALIASTMCRNPGTDVADGDKEQRGALRSVRRCGGWGPVVSDRGSAHYVVTRAIGLALEALDGMVRLCTKHSLVLLRKALKHLCNTELTSAAQVTMLVQTMERLERARIAAFAVVVTELAEGGNMVAQKALRDAGRELAMLLRGVLENRSADDDCVPFMATGGLFAAWDKESSLRDGVREGMVDVKAKWKLMRGKQHPEATHGAILQNCETNGAPKTNVHTAAIGAARLSALAVHEWNCFNGVMKLVEVKVLLTAESDGATEMLVY